VPPHPRATDKSCMQSELLNRCEIGDELGIQFMLAADQIDEARRARDHAVTQTQMEVAGTRLSRLEAHRLDMLRELLAHCLEHRCALPLSGEAAGAFLPPQCLQAA